MNNQNIESLNKLRNELNLSYMSIGFIQMMNIEKVKAIKISDEENEIFDKCTKILERIRMECDK